MDRHGPLERIVDERVDNAQTKPAATTPQFGGEEWVKDARNVVFSNAIAIVLHQELDPARLSQLGCHPDQPVTTGLERVQHRVGDEIGQHLPQRTRIGIHHHAWRNINLQPMGEFFQNRAHRQHNLGHCLIQQKPAPVGAGLVHRNLLEATHQLCCLEQAAQQDLSTVTIGRHIAIQCTAG